MSELEVPDWVKMKRRGGSTGKYKFEELEVGKTFIVPVDEQTCKFRSFQVVMYQWGKKLDRKFHCRVRPSDGAFEVWRES